MDGSLISKPKHVPFASLYSLCIFVWLSNIGYILGIFDMAYYMDDKDYLCDTVLT